MTVPSGTRSKVPSTIIGGMESFFSFFDSCAQLQIAVSKNINVIKDFFIVVLFLVFVLVIVIVLVLV